MRLLNHETAEGVPVADDFEQLTRALQDAVMQQNRPVLEGLVAPGFRLITSRSDNPAARNEWIAVAVGPFRVSSYRIGDVQVIRVHNAAVVTYRYTQDARLGEQPAARHWLTTDVWTEAGGSWQITARHAEALAD